MADTVDRNRRHTKLLLGLSAIAVLFHVLTTWLSPYGYFIDEFYYLACARRLAFGYVDHPPFTPLLLAATRTVLGDSLIGLRLPAFLAAAATVFVTGRMTLELGGGRAATVLAAVALTVSPLFLGMTGFYSVNVFEVLFWTLTTWALVRLVRTGDPRWWLVVGAVVGVGFENKHTILTLVAALGAGLLLSRERRLLWSRWMLAGAALALLLALPNVVWQIQNGWPSLEFYREAQLRKNLPSPPLQTLVVQVVTVNPFAAPLWLAGLAWVLFSRTGARWRLFGIAYLVLLGLLVMSQQSRPDRIFGIYPVLLALGSVRLEPWLRSTPRLAAAFAVVVAGALPLLPLATPLLPPARLSRYVAALGVPTVTERGKSAPIPQPLADRTGWESFVDDVARVYRALPPDDARRAIVFAPSYGQAGALEQFGERIGHARVISNHNSYFHWSAAEGLDADVLIAVDADPDDLRQIYREVEEVGRVRCDYCLSWRNDIPIFVARAPYQRLSTFWARVKQYE